MSDTGWIDRLQIETHELRAKLVKLEAFVFSESEQFRALCSDQRMLMLEQVVHMRGYLAVLQLRLDMARAAA